MLKQSEIDLITECLLSVTRGQQAPRSVLAAGLHVDLQGELGDGPPTVLVARAIELCTRDAYRLAPPAMAQFLGQLIAQFQGIAEIIARISVPPPAPPDPFSAVLLDTRLPFLARDPARTNLRALTQSAPRSPVVVINGERLRGKSYTAEFIDHVSHYLDRVQHCLVKLPTRQGASTGPGELARDLVARMGGDLRLQPPPHTNADRWVDELTNWVLATAAQGNVRWWVVLDGFNNRELRADTRKFISALADGLDAGVHRRRHRLILLDFDRTLLQLRPGRIALETIEDIPASAVEQFVTMVINGSSLDPAAITSQILSGLGDPIGDLPELGQRLENLLAVT